MSARSIGTPEPKFMSSKKKIARTEKECTSINLGQPSLENPQCKVVEDSTPSKALQAPVET